MKLGLYEELRGLWHSGSWHETFWRTVRVVLCIALAPLWLFFVWLERGPKNHWRP